MATIQVLRPDNNASLGTGEGTIEDRGSRATINRWTKKAGLQQEKTYTLKSSGKTYADMRCTGVALNDPVATFQAS